MLREVERSNEYKANVRGLTMSTLYPVYLSQIKAFNEMAAALAQFIANESSTEPLKAIKRNDYLAQALKHKGHSDLKYRAKSITQADKSEPFVLFSSPEITKAIISTFSSKMPDIKLAHIERAVNKLREFEAVKLNSTITLQVKGWTEEAVFDDEAIFKYQSKGSEYTFWLKGISTPVKALLIPTLRGNVDFRLSHYIKTPEQMGVYRPSLQSGDYYHYALERAVSSITQYYQIAVNKGHEPNDSWLVESGHF